MVIIQVSVSLNIVFSPELFISKTKHSSGFTESFSAAYLIISETEAPDEHFYSELVELMQKMKIYINNIAISHQEVDGGY